MDCGPTAPSCKLRDKGSTRKPPELGRQAWAVANPLPQADWSPLGFHVSYAEDWVDQARHCYQNKIRDEHAGPLRALASQEQSFLPGAQLPCMRHASLGQDSHRGHPPSPRLGLAAQVMPSPVNPSTQSTWDHQLPSVAPVCGDKSFSVGVSRRES